MSTIGDGAVIGGAAALHQFVRIGRAAMVGGVSGVEADVVPFGSVIGNRARLAGLNVIGLRRRGVDKARLHTIRAAFRGAVRRRRRVRQRLARGAAAVPRTSRPGRRCWTSPQPQQARADPHGAAAAEEG